MSPGEPVPDLYEVLSTTRAVRRLKPDPIPDAVLRRVLQAAAWAPSGGNRQGWRVIAVRDRGVLAELGRRYQARWEGYAAEGRKALASVDAEIAAPIERTLRAGDHLASRFAELPVVCVFCFEWSALAITDAALDRPSVVGGASVYPAVHNLLLACRAEGLGCVLTTLLVADEPEIAPLLGLPEGWGLSAFVPLGYPVGSGHGPVRRRPVTEMAYLDRFGHALFQ